MATKISRVLLKVFGGTGASTNFGKFGSEAAGSGIKTKDITTIQALSAWDNGWQDAINTANKAPFLEDMNSAFLVHSTFLAYLLQEGIPEWNTGTYYFIGSIIKKTSTSEIYVSLTDSNQGNALPVKTSNTNWGFLGELGDLTPILCRGYNSSPYTESDHTNDVGINMNFTSSPIGFTRGNISITSDSGVNTINILEAGFYHIEGVVNMYFGASTVGELVTAMISLKPSAGAYSRILENTIRVARDTWNYSAVMSSIYYFNVNDKIQLRTEAAINRDINSVQTHISLHKISSEV